MSIIKLRVGRGSEPGTSVIILSLASWWTTFSLRLQFTVSCLGQSHPLFTSAFFTVFPLWFSKVDLMKLHENKPPQAPAFGSNRIFHSDEGELWLLLSWEHNPTRPTWPSPPQWHFPRGRRNLPVSAVYIDDGSLTPLCFGTLFSFPRLSVFTTNTDVAFCRAHWQRDTAGFCFSCPASDTQDVVTVTGTCLQ